MYSWVFRHRARLRVIYGLTPAAGGADLPSQGSDGEQVTPTEAVEGCEPAGENESNPVHEPDQVAGSARLEPGSWARRHAYVVVRPMRTGAA